MDFITASAMSAKSAVFAGTALTDYFFQSNFAGQVIVVILLVFSVLAWGVMFCKRADLSAMQALNNETAKAVAKAPTLVDAAGVKSLSGPYASLLKEAVSAWMRVGMGEEQEDKSVRIAHIENTLQRTLSRQILKYNTKMTLLGTIISGAPFLGLLGTAWGVMDCFGSMSGQASVTLQMLAPGVAGALLTTVVGLCVAIPSVFGYNFLTTTSNAMAVETENFASLIADRIEIEARPRKETAPARAKPAPRPVQVREKIVEPASASEPKIINFSLDDEEEEDRPTPPRQFDE